MIGTRLAHYEIVEKIGSGGMGEVYKARDTKLGRDVAIKILPADVASDPERRKRFEREARSIAALNHPNIVTIYSVEEAEGHHFLTMELVQGQSVSEILPSDGLALEKFFKIAISVSEAINSAHTAGITHRDLKPANIMLDREGRVKVLDFGLAKLLGADETASPDARTIADSDTQEGRVLGTVPYMSPEQAEGKPVDHRSDIFSLGTVLYEMVTGVRPFKGDSSLSIMSSILRDTPSTVTELRRHLPVQLGRIIQHCLEKDPRRRFQSALDIANELRSLRTEVSSATGSVEAVTAPKKALLSKKVGISGAVGVVVLVAAFILNPFKVEIKPEQDAEAGVNTLAIMYFDNIADPDDSKRYGEITAELLITGLSESEHLRVVSSQRLYDILKQLGKEGEKRIDRSTATEVATRSQAKWMMQGRILQSEPNFVITSQIVEVTSGNVAASQRITGRPGETIFTLVDRITDETLSDLAVPVGQAAPASTVADMSTTSEEAYRYYLEGLEYERKLFRQEARASFQKATEHDSTFAIAYLHLYAFSHDDARDQALKTAVRHMGKATSTERSYIQITQAWEDNDFGKVKELADGILKKAPDDKNALGHLLRYYSGIQNDTQMAIAVANRLLDVDPSDKNTYNTIAYLYDRAGDFEKSIWAINKYIELAPNEPNPYDTRGDLYARNGHLDEAINSYSKSVEIKPDFFDYESVVKLGHMYLFKLDYEKAATEYRRLFASDDPTVRSRGRALLTLIPAYRGRVEEAIRLIDTAIAADEMEGQVSQAGRLHGIKANLLAAVEENAMAAVELEKCFDLVPDKSDLTMLGQSIAWTECGELQKASEIIAPFAARVDSLDGIKLALYDLAAGWLKYKQDDYAAAVSLIEQTKDRDWAGGRFLLGRAYIAADQADDAVDVLEKLGRSYVSDRLQSMGAIGSVLHYYLGVAYQEAGRNQEAIEQLETLLGIWDEADPRLELLHDARERLAVLKSSS